MVGSHAVSASFDLHGVGGEVSVTNPNGDASPDLLKAPTVADRYKIPASGTQGAPAEATAFPGNREWGKALFEGQCESCHGPGGTDAVRSPGPRCHVTEGESKGCGSLPCWRLWS